MSFVPICVELMLFCGMLFLVWTLWRQQRRPWVFLLLPVAGAFGGALFHGLLFRDFSGFTIVMAIFFGVPMGIGAMILAWTVYWVRAKERSEDPKSERIRLVLTCVTLACVASLFFAFPLRLPVGLIVGRWGVFLLFPILLITSLALLRKAWLTRPDVATDQCQ